MCEQQAKEIGVEIDIVVEPSRRASGAGHGGRDRYTRAPGRQSRCRRWWRRTIWVIWRRGFLAGCRDGLAAVRAGGGMYTFWHPADEPKTDYG